MSRNDERARVWLNMAKYLRDCYSELPHPSRLQWLAPFTYTSSFVDLDLFDAPLSFAEIRPLKPLALKSIFSIGDQTAKRKAVLIEGVAGSGKSTLCWYACREWAASRLFEDFRLLIRVSLSDNDIRYAMELADLIPYPNKEMRYTVAKAIAEEGGRGTCFILDSYDEVMHLSKDSFLFRFIAGSEGKSFLNSTNIILTSRPGISLDLCTCVTGKVVIRGFKSLNEFIDITLSTNGAKRDQLVETLEMKPEVHSICHLPLHAVIFVHLFDFFKDNSPTTLTAWLVLPTCVQFSHSSCACHKMLPWYYQ